jgi:hypothetical protein
MRPCPLHANHPSLTLLRHRAQLPLQQLIEVIDVLLGPFDTGTHHDHWETALVDQGGIFDEGEVDEGDLVDVMVEVTFKYTLPGRLVRLRYNREQYQGKC